MPLETIETARHYIKKSEATKGLSVIVRISGKVYDAGRQYAKGFKKDTTIKFDEHLPKWNYTAVPSNA